MNRIIIFVICCVLINQTLFAQTPTHSPADPHWKLKWEDHFTTFDNSKWERMHYGTHDSGPQLYLESNVWVDDSNSNHNLVLAANNNKATCPTPAPHPTVWTCGPCEAGKLYNYTAGWVETKEEYNVKYGYIEARIKLPHRKGVAHAFWTWKAEGETYNMAEIDIFETYGSQRTNIVNTCIYTCYPKDVPGCNDAKKYLREHNLSNFSFTDWHNYGLEWTSDRITWYIDGKSIRYLNNHNLDPWGNGIIDPVRTIFNLAIEPDYLPSTSTPFQEYMYVDYFKVYKLKYNCNAVITEAQGNGYDFNNYTSDVKKSCIFKNTSIPSGKNIFVRTTDFIELKENFEVPLGASLYLDNSPCDGDCADNLTDQTITTNTTVEGCDILNVKDVEITNSAVVNITAGEAVILKPGFRAATGTNVKVSVKQ